VTRRTWTLSALVGMVVICAGGTTIAQEQTEKEPPHTTVSPNPGERAASREARVVPLKLQVVLSKYQGEKKVSSMPYVLSLATGQPRVSLRMGGEIPIATTSAGGTVPALVSFNYRPVGTNIDCWATALDEGRYSVNIGLEDSSVYSADQDVKGLSKSASDMPSFNTFKVNETVILRDGESSQFTSATDKISGQVIKVDVTLTVLK
jgi:Flp pilus assembly secretin CpaC